MQVFHQGPSGLSGRKDWKFFSVLFFFWVIVFFPKQGKRLNMLSYDWVIIYRRGFVWCILHDLSMTWGLSWWEFWLYVVYQSPLSFWSRIHELSPTSPETTVNPILKIIILEAGWFLGSSFYLSQLNKLDEADYQQNILITRGFKKVLNLTFDFRTMETQL